LRMETRHLPVALRCSSIVRYQVPRYSGWKPGKEPV